MFVSPSVCLYVRSRNRGLPLLEHVGPSLSVCPAVIALAPGTSQVTIYQLSLFDFIFRSETLSVCLFYTTALCRSVQCHSSHAPALFASGVRTRHSVCCTSVCHGRRTTTTGASDAATHTCWRTACRTTQYVTAANAEFVVGGSTVSMGGVF